MYNALWAQSEANADEQHIVGENENQMGNRRKYIAREREVPLLRSRDSGRQMPNENERRSCYWRLYTAVACRNPSLPVECTTSCTAEIHTI